MIFGLILAGGIGSRMGADMPKQYLEIGGKPIIVHTLEHFLEYENFETIMNGIAYIEKNYGIDGETIIVTHDAARPFINKRILSENIEKAVRYGAVTTAVSAVDTILKCDDGIINDIPDRSNMYQCQTPQTFHAKQLKELYLKLTDKEREILTDASKILVLSGKKVAIVNGERTNIKITYKEDMIFAESILKSMIS